MYTRPSFVVLIRPFLRNCWNLVRSTKWNGLSIDCAPQQAAAWQQPHTLNPHHQRTVHARDTHSRHTSGFGGLHIDLKSIATTLAMTAYWRWVGSGKLGWCGASVCDCALRGGTPIDIDLVSIPRGCMTRQHLREMPPGCVEPA
jgi:hypothetical protein